MVPGVGPDKEMLVQVQNPSSASIVGSANQSQIFNDKDEGITVKGGVNVVEMPAQNETIELESVVSLV